MLRVRWRASTWARRANAWAGSVRSAGVSRRETDVDAASPLESQHVGATCERMGRERTQCWSIKERDGCGCCESAGEPARGRDVRTHGPGAYAVLEYQGERRMWMLRVRWRASTWARRANAWAGSVRSAGVSRRETDVDAASPLESQHVGATCERMGR